MNKLCKVDEMYLKFVEHYSLMISSKEVHNYVPMYKNEMPLNIKRTYWRIFQ